MAHRLPGDVILVAVGVFIRLGSWRRPISAVKDEQKVAHVPIQELCVTRRKNVLLGWGARYIDGVVFNIYAVFVIAYLVGTLNYDETRHSSIWLAAL